MPSRKIISILILTSSLVVAVILASGKNSIQSGRDGIAALKTPEVRLAAQNTGDWQKDLSVLPAPSGISTSSNQTLTDQVGQSLVANYLAMKQQGTLDNDSAKRLISQTEEFVNSAQPKKYTSDSIVISQDNSPTAVKTYGSAVGQALKINMPAAPKNEIDILVEMLKNRNVDMSQDLENISRTYGNIVGSLLKVTVPSSFASSHLKALNSLQGLAESVGMMASVQQDPLRALQGTEVYTESQPDFVDALNEMRTGINQRGVIYKQGEGGYYLFFGI